MSVYLGSAGYVELRRTSVDQPYRATIHVSDVNEAADRFSFDFPVGQFLTGDLLEFRTLEAGRVFDLVAGWTYSDASFYASVDDVGGIRLYKHFDEAVAGESKGKIELQRLASSLAVEVRVRNNIERIVAQVTSFEVNTERDAVDVTGLGDSFRQQYSSLITGSGMMSCFFEYERHLCDSANQTDRQFFEFPVYLNQLVLRSQIGSGFHARMVLIGRGEKPSGNAIDFDDEVWYEFDGVITNVGMSFEPSQPIRTQISYITTGSIQLRTRSSSNYLTQEQGTRSLLRLGEYQSGFLEVEQEE